MAFTASQVHVIQTTALAVAILSVLGSCGIIVFFWWKGAKAKKRRALYPVRLIFYMSCCDLITSCFIVASASRLREGLAWGGTPWCVAQGALQQGLYMAVNCYTTLLALVVRRQLVHGRATHEAWWHHALVVGVLGAGSAAVPLLGTTLEGGGALGTFARCASAASSRVPRHRATARRIRTRHATSHRPVL